MIRVILIMGLIFSLVGCASTQMSSSSEMRTPAGTGDVDSSTLSSLDAPMSYKLPITRKGQQKVRVAYSYWSGEWPMPIIDVFSDRPGTTKIFAYSNLRNPTPENKVSCTIQNGIYHPWSNKDASASNYYTLADAIDFKVVRDTIYKTYSYTQKKELKIRIPKGSMILNVVYGSEGYCVGNLKIGKTVRSITDSCTYFADNKDFQKVSEGDNFYEQWIYLKCEEKDARGANVKAFIQDEALLAEPGVTKGCPAGYGVAGSSKNCQIEE